jgi:succinate-semialdehyde dehydrogenase/glutarate-semialdehyde dehydrogenase
LAQRAGLPAGLLSCLTGDAVAIAGVLTASPDVRKISFTGSTRVGKILMRESAGTVKKLSLELGGNAPFIVFDDADLKEAVQGLIASKFRNAGQTCVAPNRILVHEKVEEAFLHELSHELPKLKGGNGAERGVNVGPLINPQALDKVHQLVRDAESKGARVLQGGDRHALGGNFFEPTLMSGVHADMEIACSEIFGPVLAVRSFANDDEVVALANGTQSGLAAYFYSSDLGRIFSIASRLQFGMVGVNEALFSTEVAPFGGRKESGFGREGSKYGIDDYVELKYVCMKT